MGDMAEIFNAMKAHKKQHRAEMLAKADTSLWTQHTPYHFSRVFGPVHGGERVEWWPSGGKARYRDRMIYGHRKVAALIAKLEGKTP